MSYISGNTFFIETSINCSNLETIKGQVNFIGCSKNCGTVLNAIFSGECVINYGTACGCTIFCDATICGPICGTGILRGSSILCGSADCAIQCDQSIIHPCGAATSYELLVTTPRPVDYYALDGCYYIYSSGVPTLGQGAWSDHYYCDGLTANFIFCHNGIEFPLAASVQDICECYSGCWFFYKDNTVQAAYGNFFNVSLCDCIAFTGTSPYPMCVNNPNNSPYYTMYVSGSGYNILSGIYNLGDTVGNGYQYLISLNDSLCSACFNPQECNFNFILIQNSNLLYNEDRYVYADFGGTYGGSITNPNAQAFSSRHLFIYPQNNNSVYVWNGSSANSYVIDCNYNCSTPNIAIDNGAYYIYSTGTVTIATGLYSNYAIVNGSIDTGYSTNTPYSGIDDGCHIYENGVAIALANIATVLDNDCFYYNLGSDGYIYPICYRSNSVKYAVICSDTCERMAVNPYLENGFLSILSTNNEGCVGAISSLKYTDCLDDYTILLDSTYNSCLPRDIGSGYYKIYVNGCGDYAIGAFSNYYFNNDRICTDFTCLTPLFAQDNSCYYTYESGVATLASGAYSNYYLNNGSIDTEYTCCGNNSAQIPLDVNQYFEYNAGVASLVVGCRNDVGGYYAYPTGIYNFGNTGEYNPDPCFIQFENGPYTYTYYCAGAPNVEKGVVRFSNLTVCCGIGAGDVGARCVWLYCCGVSCVGIDPRTLGFSEEVDNGLRTIPCYVCDCVYESCVVNTQYVCQHVHFCYTCPYAFVAINDVYYDNLQAGTTLNGQYVLNQNFQYCYIACDQYCDAYCDTYADCYCDMYCDVYNEEDPPVCIGQVCCGSYYYCTYCNGSVCCGQVCCGSIVSVHYCNCYCEYVTFNYGVPYGDHHIVCIYTDYVTPSYSYDSSSVPDSSLDTMNKCRGCGSYFYESRTCFINL